MLLLGGCGGWWLKPEIMDGFCSVHALQICPELFANC